MPRLLGFAANTVIRVKMAWLEHAAYRARHDQHWDRVADLHARRASLAQTLDDVPAEAESVALRADALFVLGRLREAMAVAAPALPDGPLAVHPTTTMRTLLIWLDVAIELPVSLQAIQRLDKRAEDYLQSIGHPEWRHALLWSRCRLLTFRGEFSSALAAAQEAWALWRIDHPIARSAEDLLEHVNWLYCQVGDLVGARGCIEQLARQRNDSPSYRRYILLRMEFSISFREGRLDDAVQLEKQRIELSRHWSKTPRGEGSAVTFELVYGQVAAQHIHAARRNLIQLAGMRHSENSSDRLYFFLLCGDIHLAAARRLHGLPGLDFDYDAPGSLGPAQDIVGLSAGEETRRARLAYRHAQKAATVVDDTLQGHYWTDRLRRRLDLLGQLTNRQAQSKGEQS